MPARSLLVLVVSVGLLMAGSAFAGKVAPVHGFVTGFAAGDEKPLALASIEIRPISPLKGKDRRPADDLVGIAITNDAGSWSIDELSSKSQRKAYPLLANWTYLVKVVSPGHYVFEGLVSYSGQDEPWDFMLEAKVADVVDATGTVTIEDRALQSGATRKGN